MKLVIAEKPSVGAAIAAVIGANEKRSGYFLPHSVLFRYRYHQPDIRLPAVPDKYQQDDGPKM